MSRLLILLLILTFTGTACKQIKEIAREAEKEQAKKEKKEKGERKDTSRLGASGDRQNLALGNPSGAVSDTRKPDNYLIERKAYALSYHRDRGIPNWVSWELQADDLGDLKRPPFHPDDELPNKWYRVSPNDYTRSGFDRGHMCPAADRNKDQEDSYQAFSMINIVPQAPDNNQGLWEHLESYCRGLAKEGYTLYIACGGYGFSPENTLDDGRVAVPSNLWKIIVAVPGGGIEKIDSNTRVIAVDIPNRQGVRQDDWRDYRVNVRSIEAATGYTFFSALPKDLQQELKQKVDRQ
jgi:endonuclease G, mitochondrial